MMWGRYVPVAERREEAKKKMEQLRKKGLKVYPIEIEGRTIAKKFWGKTWCEHLEKFSDYSNRLPRGRTYVRNGSVCHLEIKEGKVEARVIGSSLYTVEVDISPLKKSKWEKIKETCQGKIGSLLELLKGKLSDNVMEVVTDKEKGLLPETEEIEFTCTCPDWAGMCKHVAAVLYGIGSRLDEKPDLLFLLRKVDASELITTKLDTTTEETDDLLAGDGLSDLFGIDIDDEETKGTSSKEITGKLIKEIRTGMKLSVKDFADNLNVTPASIYRWEKSPSKLNLRPHCEEAIKNLLGKNK